MVDVYVTVKAATRLSCAKLCVAESFCRSYTYCGEKLCHLSKRETHMTAHRLVEDADCVYCGMKTDTIPACNASSTLLSQHSESYHCGNSLRLRLAWQNWQISAPFNETATEWAQVSHRECVNKLQVVYPPSNCAGDTITSKVEIIRAYNTELTWNEAGDFCGEKNGRL